MSTLVFIDLVEYLISWDFYLRHSSESVSDKEKHILQKYQIPSKKLHLNNLPKMYSIYNLLYCHKH